MRLKKLKNWKYKIFRSRQDSNLRGRNPLDFKSNALTTRPRLLLIVSFAITFQAKQSRTWASLIPVGTMGHHAVTPVMVKKATRPSLPSDTSYGLIKKNEMDAC